MTGFFHHQSIRRAWCGLLTALACALLSTVQTAHAQANTWPQRPINLVVGYPVGGTVDILARLYAEKLSSLLQQPVVVNNRAGASGTIGAQFVARARPDGYTLLFAPSTFAIAPLLVGSARLADVNQDFSPIAKVGSTPLLMLTGAKSGISSVADLVKQSSQGRAFNYASPGTGSPMHIAGEIFNRQAGIAMQHIPYSGIAPSLTDTIGGHIPIVFATHGAALPYLSDQSLIALASTSQHRTPLLSHVPSFAEAGYPDIDITAWWGFLGPKGLDARILQQLQTALETVAQQADVVELLHSMAIIAEVGDAQQLAQTIKAENQHFGAIIQSLDLRQR